MSPVRPSGRRWILWIVAPAVLGIGAGVGAAAVPWGRDALAFVMAISGLAWVLRVASDWFGERLDPQRGVVVLGSILIGTWLVLAILSPAPLRKLGFGPILVPPPERDPYALPPAGSRTPLQSLQEPAQPLDLKSLVSPSSTPGAPTPPDPETQPPTAPGDRAATTTTLSLSSATSVAGEGLVLIALVRGDGRPVRGAVEFETGGQIVARQALRVQGDASQTEYRIVGLPLGLHTIRASYLGSRSFEPSRSEAVLHRVAAR
jgi:hypothetical protein